jgi:protein MpaA
MKHVFLAIWATAALAVAGCDPSTNVLGNMWGSDKPLRTLPVIQVPDKEIQRPVTVDQSQPATGNGPANNVFYPVAKRVPLGATVEGRPLTLYLFGTGPNPTFIFAGIHGDEGVASDLARKLADHLRANPSAWTGRSVAILTEANPDGLAAGTRGNSHGVDCNRNFPASNWSRAARGARYNGGPSAASEPETRAIIQAVNMLRPGRIVSLHAISGGKHCNNYDGPAENLANKMAACNHYPVKASIGYPTPGSFGTWAGVDRNIPTITLELPSGPDAPSLWAPNRAALLAVIKDQPSSLGK